MITKSLDKKKNVIKRIQLFRKLCTIFCNNVKRMGSTRDSKTSISLITASDTSFLLQLTFMYLQHALRNPKGYFVLND